MGHEEVTFTALRNSLEVEKCLRPAACIVPIKRYPRCLVKCWFDIDVQ